MWRLVRGPDRVGRGSFNHFAPGVTINLMSATPNEVERRVFDGRLHCKSQSPGRDRDISVLARRSLSKAQGVVST